MNEESNEDRRRDLAAEYATQAFYDEASEEELDRYVHGWHYVPERAEGERRLSAMRSNPDYVAPAKEEYVR